MTVYPYPSDVLRYCAAIIAKLNGYRWNFLEQGILNSINSAMHLFDSNDSRYADALISGGVIQIMIYYTL